MTSFATMDPEQLRMMEEECILVDMNDKPIGSSPKKECHTAENIAAGMLHRAFSVFLFNMKGELLLQQRAACKVTFPLHWTNTCCSHPLYGTNETEEEEARGVKRAAIRKLEHELGIKGIQEKELHFLTKIHYKALSDGAWGEHEVDWILFLQKDVEVSKNLNEVDGLEYVTPARLQQMFDEKKSGQLLLTPWFELIAKKLLFSWWERLSTIIKEGSIGEEQRKIIHYLTEETS